jgi:hypothetical protein
LNYKKLASLFLLNSFKSSFNLCIQSVKETTRKKKGKGFLAINKKLPEGFL